MIRSADNRTSALKRINIGLTAFLILFLPIIGLNVPSTYGASLLVTPANQTIQANQTKVSSLSSIGSSSVTISFSFDTKKLDASPSLDSLVYGWRTQGGVDNNLGTILGLSGDSSNEIGTITKALPSDASNVPLELYFKNTGTTAGAGDEVYITNIAATAVAASIAAPVMTSPADDTTISSKTISFSWNPTPGAVSYEAEIGSQDGAKGADVGNVNHASFDVLDDGVYYFRVRALNADGVAGPFSEAREITIDSSKPELVFLTPSSDNQSFSSNVTISVRASDESERLGDYQLFMGDKLISDQKNLGANQPQDVTITTTDLSEGSYSLRATLSDEAGNETEITRTIMIDKTAPSAPTIISSTSEDAPMVTGSSEPLANITLTIGDRTYSTAADSAGDWSIKLETLSAGTYRAGVSATDEAGNTGEVLLFDITVNDSKVVEPTVPALTPSIGTVAPLAALPTMNAVAGISMSTRSVLSQPAASDIGDLNGSASQNGAVLGTQVANTDAKKAAAIQTSPDGWRLFGLSWYWWFAATFFGVTAGYLFIRRMRSTAT